MYIIGSAAFSSCKVWCDNTARPSFHTHPVQHECTPLPQKPNPCLVSFPGCVSTLAHCTHQKALVSAVLEGGVKDVHRIVGRASALQRQHTISVYTPSVFSISPS